MSTPALQLVPNAAARFRIGQLAIDRLSFAEALDRIEALVKARRGAAVFTPNVDHVVLAERNAEFRAAYAAADLSLVDGTPLLWAARLLHEPLPEKISGSDLVVPLMGLAAQRRWRVYLLGSTPEACAAAWKRLADLGVRVVGTDSPVIRLWGRDDTEAALARLRAARPDLVLVGLGAPKQEIWIHRHRAELGSAVALGIGAAIDFLAGRVRRAPPWISRAGLEWLYRLAHEPRRLWRRYLVNDPAFLRVLARELTHADR